MSQKTIQLFYLGNFDIIKMRERFKNRFKYDQRGTLKLFYFIQFKRHLKTENMTDFSTS